MKEKGMPCDLQKQHAMSVDIKSLIRHGKGKGHNDHELGEIADAVVEAAADANNAGRETLDSVVPTVAPPGPAVARTPMENQALAAAPTNHAADRCAPVSGSLGSGGLTLVS